MSDSGHNRILSAADAVGLTGRERELEAVIAHAAAAAGSALLFASAPGLCASEILRKAYDDLFNAGRGIAPIYFKFLPSDLTARRASERFLREFLVQYVAFRRREPLIARAHPDVCELTRLAPAIDEEWVADAVRACEAPSDLNTDPQFIVRAFGAPQRASVSGTRCFVIIDGLENTLLIEDGEELPALLERVLSSGVFPYVLSGRRRFIRELDARRVIGTKVAGSVTLEPFDFGASAELTRTAAGSAGVTVTEQSADLAAVLLDSRPQHLRSLFGGGSEDLRSFKDLLTAYFGSIEGGRLGGYFDEIVGSVGEQTEIHELILLMAEMADKGASVSSSTISNRLRTLGGLRFLEANEVVDIDFDRVRVSADILLCDFLRSRAGALSVKGPRSRVAARLVGDGLKRAAGMMASVYRQAHAIGIVDLLKLFDCQEVPLALLDYGIFNETYKGAATEELLSDMRGDLEKLKLPQIFYADSAAEFYSPLGGIIDDSRAAIAFGFEHAEYDDENEVVWLAAEIDSKLEATEELASFWCDRLEMAAVANDLPKYRIWLIAPEGFSPAAIEALHERRAIGSSRAQVRLLESLLRTGDLNGESGPEKFELVIPMGDDTELIAAHAVEDIARKSGFDTSAVNQIKTALVEACINAAEHSMSPDGKIMVAIENEPGRLVLTIANRGVRFSGEKAEANRESEERRGWGLKLMRSLMDEVRFERVDDGTRIVMTKLIKSRQD